ncbi:radical SAM protein [Pseudomonas sp. HY13-MNA-CIBAN-0226]
MNEACCNLLNKDSDNYDPTRLALVSLPYGEGPQKVMPLGLQNISAYVKKHVTHVKCKIFDYSDLYTSDSHELKDLIDWQPALVGISIFSSHVQAAIAWGELIKSALPETVLFCGGPHISLAAKDFLRVSNGIFELALYGEGEHSTATLLKLFNKSREEASDSPPTKNTNNNPIPKKILIDNYIQEIPNAVWISEIGETHETYKQKIQLPATEWENPLLEYCSERLQNLYFTDRRDGKKRKAIALTSSRGCPLACSFCAIVAADKDGPKWRAVDATTLIDWIVEAHKKYSFEHIYMMDANFFVRKERVLDFSEKLYKLFGGEVTWSSSSTVGYLLKLRTELPKLVTQGLRLVEMGIESGSQTQLDYMNKRVTVKNNTDAIIALQINGIDIGLDFIMFYHDQQKREIIENLSFLLHAGLTEHESFDHYFNIMMIYPGTPVRDNIERKMGIKFNLIALPNSRQLIENQEVKEIYDAYIDHFAKPLLNSLENAIIINIEKISQSTSRGEIAHLSLLNIYLRHMPFKILWGLCQLTGERRTIFRGEEFLTYTYILKKISNGTKANNSPKRVALETFTLGVGGRKGELIGKSA